MSRILTEIELIDIPSLQRALKILHNKYHVPNIVISSILLKPWLLCALPPSIRPADTSESCTDHLLCISSSIASESFFPSAHNPDLPSEPTIHAGTVPLISGYFSGVGDLFSALVLAHFHPPCPPSNSSHPQTLNPTQTPNAPTTTPLSLSTSLALSKTHSLLKFTQVRSQSLPEEDRQPTDDELDSKDPVRKTKRMRGRELALIQGQDIIRSVQDADMEKMKLWSGFWDLAPINSPASA